MQLHVEGMQNGASFEQKVPFELALKGCVGLDAEMDTLIQDERVMCRAGQEAEVKLGSWSFNRLCVLRMLSCLIF